VTRAFVSINDPLQWRLAEALAAAGIDLACIESTTIPGERLRAAFPGSLVVGAYGELLDPSWSPPTAPLFDFSDSALLADCSATLMQLMARLLPHDQLAQIEKDAFLRRILQNMRALLDHCGIDLAVYWNEPHQISHYLIYELLRRRGGRIAILQKTAFADHYCLLDRIGGRPAQRGPQDAPDPHFEAAFEAVLERATAPRQILDPRVSAKLTQAKRRGLPPPYDIITDGLRRKWELGKRRIRSRPPDARVAAALRAEYPLLQALRTWRNHRAYSTHARRTLPKRETEGIQVFISLQCQPERQTAPASFPFYDQIAAIGLVAAHAHHVLVKEHPSQFAPYQRNYLGRSEAFYREIAAFGNVTLLHHSTDTFTTIDRCDAVVVLAGTVGWEALLRGKTVLTFGCPWYLHAPVAPLHHVTSTEALSALMAEGTEGAPAARIAEELRIWSRSVVWHITPKVADTVPDEIARLAETIGNGA
jgi:hypothetical protein